MGLPLTSLPFLLLVGLDEGPWSARSTAGGILVGQAAVVACCGAYAYVARSRGWVSATAVGGVAAVLASGALVTAHAPVWAAMAVLVALLAGVLASWPRWPLSADDESAGNRWKRDVVFRTVVATACVVAATKASGAFGPQVAGALVAFPTVPLVHAAFTQRRTGTTASIRLIQSMLTGLWCGSTFVLLIALTAGPLGILPACGVAAIGATIARLAAQPVSRALGRLRLAARLRYRVRARLTS